MFILLKENSKIKIIRKDIYWNPVISFPEKKIHQYQVLYVKYKGNNKVHVNQGYKDLGATKNLIKSRFR